MAIPEASLQDAADNVFGDVYIHWLTGVFKTKTQQFCNNTLLELDTQLPLNMPLANWCAVLSAYNQQATEPALTRMQQDTFTELTRSLYRLLSLAAYAEAQSWITPAQATDILAAFNNAYA